MHDDAPGWHQQEFHPASGLEGVSSKPGSPQQDNDLVGPVCWKCKGVGWFKKKAKLTSLVADTTSPSTNTKRKRTELRQANCTVCNGRGRILKKRKEAESLKHPGRVAPKRLRKPPEGYHVPGPKPLSNKAQPLDGEELCSLVGYWKIYQRIGGHRWSTDDLVTAWAAGRAVEDFGLAVENYLDLGCGIGSVLQMVAWQLPAVYCKGIEAQYLSASMAKRSLDFNLGTSAERRRCEVIEGDMRSVSLGSKKFELVTGTPPYFKVDFSSSGAARAKTGGMPTCKQSAPARYEFRGGIESYCEAASRFLKEDGLFVVCEGLGERSNSKRVVDGAEQANLRILKSLMVHGREDKPPLFGVYIMCRKACSKYSAEHKNSSLSVRTTKGERTEEYKQLMLGMGIVP